MGLCDAVHVTEVASKNCASAAIQKQAPLQPGRQAHAWIHLGTPLLCYRHTRSVAPRTRIHVTVSLAVEVVSHQEAAHIRSKGDTSTGMLEPLAPVVRDVVLLGGGHPHVEVLRQFGLRPLPGVRLTLIASSIDTPYR